MTDVKARMLYTGVVAVLAMSVSAAQASVVISTDTTQNMSCSAGVCSPTAKKAVLNVNDLTNMLASGDVKITTGAGAQTITVAAPFSWASTSRLTLDAYYNVSFRAPVTVAGTGAVTITYNDGGSGGDLLFFAGGKLDFWDTRSSLIVNDKSFTLARDIKSLAAEIAGNPAGAYALANDYDAKADGVYSNAPIPTDLGGMVDGLGNTISNLTIRTESDWVGLFAHIKQGGSLQHLRLSKPSVAGKRPFYLGALVGINEGTVFQSSAIGGQARATGLDHHSEVQIGGLVGDNFYGTIASSFASDLVKVNGSHASSSELGGLVGFNLGTIQNSASRGAVLSLISNTSAGGLVGDNYAGTIVQSHASGAVTSLDNSVAGGLVGWNTASLELSYATGNVTAEDGSLAGGLAGHDSGMIALSFSTGSATTAGAGSAGGLAGSADEATISDSFAVGAASGGADAHVGGVIGDTYRVTLRRSYSTGALKGGAGSFIGGAVGDDRGLDAFSRTYWDLDTSGVSDPTQGAGNTKNDAGITGLTDAQLKSGLPAGFDPTIWGQSPSINNGYPYLLANPPQ